MRLDIFLQKKEYFNSRQQAQNAIKDGLININGSIITKNNYIVEPSDIIIVKKREIEYASRGGYKLAAAIKAFNLDFNDKRVLDLGSSTGGFTDCALQHGANSVVAVDVGTDQMVSFLRNNPKVILYEKTNIKNLLTILPAQVFEIVVMDVSFISVTKLLMIITNYLDQNSNFIVLIKPQFEAKNQNIDKNGRVSDRSVHISILNEVIDKSINVGLHMKSLIFSPLLGEKSRNIEYLMLLSRKHADNLVEIEKVVNDAFLHLLAKGE